MATKSGEPATAMSRLSSTESDPDDPSVALLSAHGTPPAGHLLMQKNIINKSVNDQLHLIFVVVHGQRKMETGARCHERERKRRKDPSE